MLIYKRTKNSQKRLLMASALLSLFFATQASATFQTLTAFGDNPGDLEATYFQPAQKSNALVVLLHGCLQNGEELATNTGLIGLAKKHNFSVLIPQQSKLNNITACFNWFSEQDSTKDQGETLSLKNMITNLNERHQYQNIYIAGLSAGGAMTSSMLMNYPEMFKAGAVIAGVPYPCADGLIKAISCMKNGPASGADLVEGAQTLLAANSKLPKLTIWTGANDNVVSPKNAEALAMQWQQLNKLKSTAQTTITDGVTIKQWKNTEDQTMLELVSIAGIEHGIMVNPKQENGGVVGDYLLKSPIATMPSIINFFGLKNK